MKGADVTCSHLYIVIEITRYTKRKKMSYNTKLGDYETWRTHLVRSLHSINVYQLHGNCKDVIDSLYGFGFTDAEAAQALSIYKKH